MMLKHTLTNVNRTALMGGPIFQKTISSAMTTSRGFRMGYGMSKLGRFGIVNTGVKN